MKKYTAEQIEGEVADMSAEGYPDGLRTNMLRAFAATLRQQGEQATVDSLKRDAERYRWLRDRMAVEDMPEEHPSWSTPSEHESRKFDAAVDSAMNGANARHKARGEATSA